MENYKKGKNIEEPLERDKIPITDLPDDFLWMHVRGGSKIRNLLPLAMKDFQEKRFVVWTGFGPSVGKAITCAEIMKKEFGNRLHQITKLCYRLVEEYWDPLIPELDQLVVKRQLPMIHILLSLDILNTEELGYQAPGVKIEYKSRQNQQQKNRNRDKRPKKQFSKTPTKELAALQVENKQNKRKQNKEFNTENENTS